jgi:hypothetical protein
MRFSYSATSRRQSPTISSTRAEAVAVVICLPTRPAFRSRTTRMRLRVRMNRFLLVGLLAVGRGRMHVGGSRQFKESRRAPGAENTLFLSFPYVCPEPVLAKRSFFIYKWLKNARTFVFFCFLLCLFVPSLS